MEKIRINDEEKAYEILSIRQISPDVLEIVFACDIPNRWGDISVYTSGGYFATLLSGYNTLLLVDGQTVQVASDPTAEPGESEDPEQPEPLYKRLETAVISMQARNVVLERAVSFAAVSFTDEQALQVPEVYPEYHIGVMYKTGDRIRYSDVLYKVLQDHISQDDWGPDIAHSLYTVVGMPDTGTKDNPISWVSGMESEAGKYYTDEGVLYIGLEDSGVGLVGQPKDLARYFEKMEE